VTATRVSQASITTAAPTTTAAAITTVALTTTAAPSTTASPTTTFFTTTTAEEVIKKQMSFRSPEDTFTSDLLDSSSAAFQARATLLESTEVIDDRSFLVSQLTAKKGHFITRV